MISRADGKYYDEAYRYQLLSTGTFQHWTAAGDIDNDGDPDFMFHNIKAKTQTGNKIVCFINDGKANFTAVECVDPPRVKRTDKCHDCNDRFYSWGGTLFDLNGDNFLDLWLSRSAYNTPIVLLGDGTGSFSKDNYVEVFLPNNWPTVMKQFGYVVAADLEDDGFNEIFFSVQGIHELSPNKCKGSSRPYCGSYVGYFKNVDGFLEFGGFIKKVEKDQKFKWARTSMIVVKDYWGNDGMKDIYLKRHFYENDSPFFVQLSNGKFSNISMEEFNSKKSDSSLLEARASLLMPTAERLWRVS